MGCRPAGGPGAIGAERQSDPGHPEDCSNAKRLLLFTKRSLSLNEPVCECPRQPKI